MLGAAFATPLLGPVLAQLEFAVGRTANDGGLLGDAGWSEGRGSDSARTHRSGLSGSNTAMGRKVAARCSSGWGAGSERLAL
jgi:hypothetical protein